MIRVTQNLPPSPTEEPPLFAEPPEPAAEIGPEPRLEWLPLDLLYVDPRYQREIARRSAALIRTIVEQFHWSKYQPPTVTAVDGRYAIIDGQHRVEAARLHPLVDAVPCYVVVAETVRDQAQGFLAINGDRLPVAKPEMHHAQVAAGDPDALHLQAICDQAEVAIPRRYMTREQMKPRQFSSIHAAKDGLKRYGDRPVLEALRLLGRVSEHEGESLRAPLIRCLIRLFWVYRDHPIDSERLFRVITKHSTEELQEQGKAYGRLFHADSTDAIREAIVKAYNKGVGKDRRLPEQARKKTPRLAAT
ncbi:MAG TPA: DUF6551 family protein [Alphaproteobacteria bacterium]|nr:DUF6551 family protein [Alphaproteobacteria bacterium]